MEIKVRVFLDDILIDSYEQECNGGMWVMLEAASKAAQKKFPLGLTFMSGGILLIVHHAAIHTSLTQKSELRIEVEDSLGTVSETLTARPTWVKVRESSSDKTSKE